MNDQQLERVMMEYAGGLPPDSARAMLGPEVRERYDLYSRKVMHRALRRRLRKRLGYAGASVAVAACLVWVFFPSNDLQLEIDVASQRRELWTRGTESTAPRDQFWIGVKVSKPCWIQVIERTVAGELVVVRPGASSTAYSVYLEGSQNLGPFSVIEPNALSGPAAVSDIFVIASAAEIAAEDLEAGVPRTFSPKTSNDELDAEIATFLKDLQKQRGWRAKHAVIPRGPS